MAEIGNQYSFVIFGFIGLIALFAFLRWRRMSWGATLMVLVIAGSILTLGNLALRPGWSDVDTFNEAESLIANGQPTLVEFFSNYCINCVIARPTVDALVADIRADYGEDFNILRVNIHTDLGRALRERYGFTYSPEFVLFDRAGTEIWRANVPPTNDLIERAAV